MIFRQRGRQTPAHVRVCICAGQLSAVSKWIEQVGGAGQGCVVLLFPIMYLCCRVWPRCDGMQITGCGMNVCVGGAGEEGERVTWPVRPVHSAGESSTRTRAHTHTGTHTQTANQRRCYLLGGEVKPGRLRPCRCLFCPFNTFLTPTS